MKKIIILIILIILIVVGFSVSNNEEVAEPHMEGDQMEGKMMDDGGEVQTNLFDVTDGLDVRGINTGDNASGVASAVFDGQYKLVATFDNLPDPVGTDFYEGWVVRKGNFNVISTGKLERDNGVYVNNFTDSRDLLDHNFYVLTLEPDDGDPAPADHIVEGDIN